VANEQNEAKEQTGLFFISIFFLIKTFGYAILPQECHPKMHMLVFSKDTNYFLGQRHLKGKRLMRKIPHQNLMEETGPDTTENAKTNMLSREFIIRLNILYAFEYLNMLFRNCDTIIHLLKGNIGTGILVTKKYFFSHSECEKKQFCRYT